MSKITSSTLKVRIGNAYTLSVELSFSGSTVEVRISNAYLNLRFTKFCVLFRYKFCVLFRYKLNLFSYKLNLYSYKLSDKYIHYCILLFSAVENIYTETGPTYVLIDYSH